MNQTANLLDELHIALASGDARQRQTTLKRITDYFMLGSTRYTDEQVALFDDVFVQLSTDIEVKALAQLARTLAPAADAPKRTIRSLALHDEIAVAGPVLTTSERLSADDLIETVRSKSQSHMLAISKRASLSEDVTEALVDHGDRRVVRSVAQNDGARDQLAEAGIREARAKDDETLTHSIGRRKDVPRHHFLRLVANASASVRARLEAAIPEASAIIAEAVAGIAGDLSRDSREASAEHAKVKKHAKLCYSMRDFTEANVHAPARAQDFERTVVALALYGHFPVDLVERALIDEGADMVLILSRVADLSHATVKALLTMQSGGRGLSEQDLEDALFSYDRLKLRTAKRVLDFYAKRKKVADKVKSEKPAKAGDKDAIAA